MSVTCGIVGLPRVGKTTVFNALTASQAQVHAFAGGSKDPNMAVVPVPDPRLTDMGREFKSKKITPATLEFVDLAVGAFPLVLGAKALQPLNHSPAVPTPVKDQDLLFVGRFQAPPKAPQVVMRLVFPPD